MRRAARALAAAVALLAPLALGAAPSAAAPDGGASVAHVESSGGKIRVLVSVPPGTEVDLGGVSASLEGDHLDSTATPAGTGGVVDRTAVLAIDTSSSMARGGRFDAAKAAALAYLSAVPSDVEVGIVTFDSEVTTALAPTTDRGAAEDVVKGLDLSKGTLLYDGVDAAVTAAGDSGQRSILVLSDGADTGSSASIDDVASTIDDADALVDVVSLGQTGSALDALRSMTDAGHGSVIDSSGDALTQAFAHEADILASQILVTAPLPDGFDASEATISIRLPAGDRTLVATALAQINRSSAPDASSTQVAVPDSGSGGWDVPSWVLYAATAALAVGLIGVAVLLVPGPPAPMSIADRVAAYSRVTRPDAAQTEPSSEPVLDQAKAAAADILERHSGLNERLTRRLGAAGSEFKPSEWLLVHIGVMAGFALLGLLFGGGSVIMGLIFLVLGAFAPPLYLTFRAARRRKQFQDSLPEVLQLISGALSAGLSLAQAVDTVTREGPEPIASEFKRVLVEARIGVDLEDSFEGVAERFDSRDFAWAVMAIRIQRQVGGNLAELLTTVAATMRERQSLRRHVRGLSAEGRLSAYLLCSLPPLFAIYLFMTNRKFLDPLMHDPRGWALDGFGILWMGIGTFLMFRIVKVDL
ncbi:type II secretion system F family protein [Nocardioides panacisoli]|uniref:VWFA domain-containing protein n=1 Tax=Nocardioides panacisoli TaxID=627624 RepID=A0ABP7I9M1_9ACTN